MLKLLGQFYLLELCENDTFVINNCYNRYFMLKSTAFVQQHHTINKLCINCLIK